MTPVYDAYLSYSHRDARFAQWLQRGIETYRVPLALQRGGCPARLSRLFRDRDELPSSDDLTSAMRQALQNSAALIVVCSPDAATSTWVNEEVRHYKLHGSSHRIFPIIADGEPPHCFPPALRYDLDADGNLSDVEAHPVAADARPKGDGRRNARLKLIAGLLGVGFDELKHRDQHRQHRRMAAITAASLAVAATTGVLALLAVDARNDAERRRSQAEELIAFMIGDLRGQLATVGRLDILDSVGDKSMAFYASLESEDETDDVLHVRVKALRQIGEVRTQQGRLADAAEAFRQSFELAQSLHQRRPERTDYLFELGQAHFWNGYVFYLWSNPDAAREHFESYRTVAEELIASGPDDDSFRMELAYAHSNLGTLEVDAGNAQAARAHFVEAVRINEALLEMAPTDQTLTLDLAGGYSWLGALAEAEGDVEQAISWYRREMALRHRLLQQDGGWEHLARAAVGSNLLGFQLFVGGHHGEARDTVQQSIELSLRLVSHDPENLGWRRTLHVGQLTLAQVSLAANDLPLARRHIDAAVPGLAQLVQDDPSNVFWRRDYATALMLRARVLLHGGDAAAAARAITAAAELAENLEEGEDASSQWLGGTIALTQGDVAAAHGAHEEARSRWRSAVSRLQEATRISREPAVTTALREALRRADPDGVEPAAGSGNIFRPAVVPHQNSQ